MEQTRPTGCIEKSPVATKVKWKATPICSDIPYFPHMHASARVPTPTVATEMITVPIPQKNNV
eukprot:2866295-Amphidinium_carterae.1